MFIISTILDRYFRLRMKSYQYRTMVYEKAINNKLRKTKTGNIVLRNIGKLMSEKIIYHKEFYNFSKNGDFQKTFWDSDLGFLWFKGNSLGKSKNPYFQIALNTFEKNKYTSHLDVGCGWGDLSSMIASIDTANSVIGIDIAEGVIKIANEKYSWTGAKFYVKDIMEVEENFDLCTVFGSADYIPPERIYGVLEHLLRTANREILIVNSLRGIPLQKALETETSVCVERYDVGYLHPLNFMLKKLQKKNNFSFEIEKISTDSILAKIKLVN